MMILNPTDGVSGIGEAAVPELTTALQNRIDRMSDDDLTAAILETKRAIEALSASLHLFVADFDRREIADRVHVLTTKQWLTTTCAMSGTEASGVVETSKALTVMPKVLEGALTGAVPATHIGTLARARGRWLHVPYSAPSIRIPAPSTGPRGGERYPKTSRSPSRRFLIARHRP